ncbi:MAG TPA: NapC/NirT family cytochrome c [candidate division Zixibacteria bacterium]
MSDSASHSSRRSIIKPKSLISNPISFAGVLVAACCLLIIAFILVADWMGFEWNPYVGVVALLVLPAIATFGFLLIPAGKAWERRRRAKSGAAASNLIRVEIDLDSVRTRRRLLVYAATATLVISFMMATAYKSLVFMDTTTFCGEVCHTVMQPELTSYRHGPHARVACVECHIGEGADWFVKSKLSGVRQVFAVALKTYSTPIPVPVHNLRPARETCEHCHWPEKFHGSKLVVKTRYQEDEANTSVKNVLLMKIGGGNIATGEVEGIHWHTSFQHSIEYVALDEQRDTIPYVRMIGPDGTATEYVSDDSRLTADELRAMPRRVMDCMDCHNRPSHVFDDPAFAVDEAMVSLEIDPALPYIKRQAVELLTTEYATRDEAARQIPSRLQTFYREQYPDIEQEKSEAVNRAGTAIADIYLRNVFPAMKVTWGTYTTHIGHTRSDGCFRCHDEAHSAPDGRTISGDCSTCHDLLAYEEENPIPTLEELPRR